MNSRDDLGSLNLGFSVMLYVICIDIVLVIMTMYLFTQ